MTDDERMMQALREYVIDLGDPESSWPKEEFDRVTYSQWAVDEILRLLYSNVTWSPLRAAEEFRVLMDNAKKQMEYHEEIYKIFNIAFHAAIDISDILTAMI